MRNRSGAEKGLSQRAGGETQRRSIAPPSCYLLHGRRSHQLLAINPSQGQTLYEPMEIGIDDKDALAAGQEHQERLDALSNGPYLDRYWTKMGRMMILEEATNELFYPCMFIRHERERSISNQLYYAAETTCVQVRTDLPV